MVRHHAPLKQAVGPAVIEVQRLLHQFGNAWVAQVASAETAIFVLGDQPPELSVLRFRRQPPTKFKLRPPLADQRSGDAVCETE